MNEYIAAADPSSKGSPASNNPEGIINSVSDPIKKGMANNGFVKVAPTADMIYQSTNRTSYDQTGGDRNFIGENFNTDELDFAEYQAQSQSVGAKLGKGLARIGTKAITEIAKIPGFVGGIGMSLYDATSGDGFDIETLTNNAWIKGLNDANQAVNDSALKVYATNASQHGTLWDAVSSSSFWATDGADGLGYIIGAMAPGAIISKLGLGAKVIQGMSSVGSAGSKTLNALTLGAEGSSVASKGLSSFGVAKKLAGLGVTAKNVDLALITTANTLFESFAEAGGVLESMDASKGEFIQTNFGEQIDQLEASLINGEITQADYDVLKADLDNKIETTFNERKAKAASNVMFSNFAILAGPNFLQASMLYGGPTKGGALLGKLTNSPSKTKSFAKGLASSALSEGLWEEGMQSVVETAFTKRAKDLKLSDSFFDGWEPTNIISEYADMITSTDGQKAVFLGAVFGGLIGGVGNMKAEANQVKLANAWAMSGVKSYSDMFSALDNQFMVNDDGQVIMEDDGVTPKKNPLAMEKLAEALGSNLFMSHLFSKTSDQSERMFVDQDMTNEELLDLYRQYQSFNLANQFANFPDTAKENMVTYFEAAKNAIESNEGANQDIKTIQLDNLEKIKVWTESQTESIINSEEAFKALNPIRNIDTSKLKVENRKQIISTFNEMLASHFKLRQVQKEIIEDLLDKTKREKSKIDKILRKKPEYKTKEELEKGLADMHELQNQDAVDENGDVVGKINLREDLNNTPESTANYLNDRINSLESYLEELTDVLYNTFVNPEELQKLFDNFTDSANKAEAKAKSANKFKAVMDQINNAMTSEEVDAVVNNVPAYAEEFENAKKARKEVITKEENKRKEEADAENVYQTESSRVADKLGLDQNQLDNIAKFREFLLSDETPDNVKEFFKDLDDASWYALYTDYFDAYMEGDEQGNVDPSFTFDKYLLELMSDLETVEDLKEFAETLLISLDINLGTKPEVKVESNINDVAETATETISQEEEVLQEEAIIPNDNTSENITDFVEGDFVIFNNNRYYVRNIDPKTGNMTLVDLNNKSSTVMRYRQLVTFQPKMLGSAEINGVIHFIDEAGNITNLRDDHILTPGGLYPTTYEYYRDEIMKAISEEDVVKETTEKVEATEEAKKVVEEDSKQEKIENEELKSKEEVPVEETVDEEFKETEVEEVPSNESTAVKGKVEEITDPEIIIDITEDSITEDGRESIDDEGAIDYVEDDSLPKNTAVTTETPLLLAANETVENNISSYVDPKTSGGDIYSDDVTENKPQQYAASEEDIENTQGKKDELLPRIMMYNSTDKFNPLYRYIVDPLNNLIGKKLKLSIFATNKLEKTTNNGVNVPMPNQEEARKALDFYNNVVTRVINSESGHTSFDMNSRVKLENLMKIRDNSIAKLKEKAKKENLSDKVLNSELKKINNDFDKESSIIRSAATGSVEVSIADFNHLVRYLPIDMMFDLPSGEARAPLAHRQSNKNNNPKVDSYNSTAPHHALPLRIQIIDALLAGKINEVEVAIEKQLGGQLMLNYSEEALLFMSNPDNDIRNFRSQNTSAKYEYINISEIEYFKNMERSEFVALMTQNLYYGREVGQLPVRKSGEGTVTINEGGTIMTGRAASGVIYTTIPNAAGKMIPIRLNQGKFTAEEAELLTLLTEIVMEDGFHTGFTRLDTFLERIDNDYSEAFKQNTNISGYIDLIKELEGEGATVSQLLNLYIHNTKNDNSSFNIENGAIEVGILFYQSSTPEQKALVEKVSSKLGNSTTLHPSDLADPDVRALFQEYIQKIRKNFKVQYMDNPKYIEFILDKGHLVTNIRPDVPAFGNPSSRDVSNAYVGDSLYTTDGNKYEMSFNAESILLHDGMERHPKIKDIPTKELSKEDRLSKKKSEQLAEERFEESKDALKQARKKAAAERQLRKADEKVKAEHEAKRVMEEAKAKLNAKPIVESIIENPALPKEVTEEIAETGVAIMSDIDTKVKSFSEKSIDDQFYIMDEIITTLDDNSMQYADLSNFLTGEDLSSEQLVAKFKEVLTDTAISENVVKHLDETCSL